MDLVWFDLASLLLAVAFFTAYFVTVRLRLRRQPNYTVQAVNRAARTHWAARIAANSGSAILAVQTLRNGIMASTFLASTAVLLVIGTLTLINYGGNADTSWHLFNLMGAGESGVWLVKILLLLGDFVVAFFSFALSLRLLVHAGYHVMPDAERTEAGARHLGRLLNRSALYYTIGMRAYIAAVPLVFALFGPLFTLAAALGSILLLSRLDREGVD